MAVWAAETCSHTWFNFISAYYWNCCVWTKIYIRAHYRRYYIPILYFSLAFVIFYLPYVQKNLRYSLDEMSVIGLTSTLPMKLHVAVFRHKSNVPFNVWLGWEGSNVCKTKDRGKLKYHTAPPCLRQMLLLPPWERTRVHGVRGRRLTFRRGWPSDTFTFK